MNDEGVAVLRELGSSRRQDSRCHLHAEVLVQGNVGESTGGSFDDVSVGQPCGLFVDGASPDIFTLRVEKLRHDS